MTAPRVYAAIHAVSAALATQGVPKSRHNRDDDYLYRSIDDVTCRLAPLLASHKLCILPRVLERTESQRSGDGEPPLFHVVLRIALDLVSAEDGSSHTIEVTGEALDASDKATAKAMTAAWKHGVLQALCVPATGTEDPDACSVIPLRHRARNGHALLLPAPVEGWAQWAADIAAVVSACVSSEAIDRLLSCNRAQLTSLAREEPKLYQELGRQIADKRAALAQPGGAGEAGERASNRAKLKGRAQKEVRTGVGRSAAGGAAKGTPGSAASVTAPSAAGDRTNRMARKAAKAVALTEPATDAAAAATAASPAALRSSIPQSVVSLAPAAAAKARDLVQPAARRSATRKTSRAAAPMVAAHG